MARGSIKAKLVLLVATGALFLTGTAEAQLGIAGTTGTTTTTTTTTAFGSADFFVGVQHQAGSNLTDFEIQRFFNQANCNCNADVFIYVALTSSGAAKRGSITAAGDMQILLGPSTAGCDQPLLRASYCLLLNEQPFATFANVGRNTVQTNARVISAYTVSGVTVDGGTPTTQFPTTGNPDCTLPVASFNQSIWVIADTDGDGTYDVNFQTQVPVDLTPPPAPDPNSITVAGGNEAVVVSWPSVDTVDNPLIDLLGYQVLCNRAGSLQVFKNGTFDPGYQVCEGNADGGTPIGTGTVEGIDPNFICSPLLGRTATSYRVKILQNDITYGVGVVAVDNSGNASTPTVVYGTPIKTESFYDVYRQGGIGQEGQATGGFCAVAPASGRSRRQLWTGLGAALALGASIVIVRRRRRR